MTPYLVHMFCTQQVYEEDFLCKTSTQNATFASPGAKDLVGNFLVHTEDLWCEIRDDNSKTVGYCFKYNFCKDSSQGQGS